MSYYNTLVSNKLVEKLYNAGYRKIEKHEFNEDVYYDWVFYADVFDWLMEKGIAIYVSPCLVPKTGEFVFNAGIMSKEIDRSFGYRSSWHESANAAIEKAVEILNERNKQKETEPIGFPDKIAYDGNYYRVVYEKISSRKACKKCELSATCKKDKNAPCKGFLTKNQRVFFVEQMDQEI